MGGKPDSRQLSTICVQSRRLVHSASRSPQGPVAQVAEETDRRFCCVLGVRAARPWAEPTAGCAAQQVCTRNQQILSCCFATHAWALGRVAEPIAAWHLRAGCRLQTLRAAASCAMLRSADTTDATDAALSHTRLPSCQVVTMGQRR
jgi:hypothetical protein